MPTLTEPRDIFSNIASKDYLSLFEGGRPKYKAVTEILGFRKPDVAKATAVPLGSVRNDERMPQELVDRLAEWANLLNLVAGHFSGDMKRTAMWFAARNPMLGDIAPRDMVRFGRYNKLLKFVLNALTSNRK